MADAGLTFEAKLAMLIDLCSDEHSPQALLAACLDHHRRDSGPLPRPSAGTPGAG